MEAEKRVIDIFRVLLPVMALLTFSYFLYYLSKGNFNWFYIYLISYVVLIMIYHAVIRDRITNIKIFTVVKIINVSLETTTTSVVIILLAKTQPPEVIISGPLVMIYVLMILMTGFRYSMRLSFYSSILAVIQYVLICMYLVRGVSPEIKSVIIDLGNGGLFQKSLYILLSGIVSGLLAHNTKVITKKVAVSSYEQFRIKNTFGQYVSNEVRDYILSGEFDLTGEEKYGVILFSDLRNFTGIMERTEPKNMINQLNEYFTGMVDVIGKNDGIVNKFIGDAIMAVFGIFDNIEKKEKESPELLAVKAAVGMQKKLDELNKKWEKEGKEPLRMGIGLDAGYFITGNIGCEDRMEFTCIGHVINSSLNIEELTKQYGKTIIVSDKIFSKIKPASRIDFQLAPLTEYKTNHPETVSALYEVVIPGKTNEEPKSRMQDEQERF